VKVVCLLHAPIIKEARSKYGGEVKERWRRGGGEVEERWRRGG
jgi:hypothetical protein